MTDKNSLKQRKASNEQYSTMRGIVYVGAGILIGGVLFSNCRDCKGTSTHNNPDAGVNNNASAYDGGIDAGEISLYDAGAAEQSTGDTCHGPQYVQDLEQKLWQCENELNICRSEWKYARGPVCARSVQIRPTLAAPEFLNC